jgi:hypothetical protein
MTILKSNSAFAARDFALFSETTSQLASATGSLACRLFAPAHCRRAKVAPTVFPPAKGSFEQSWGAFCVLADNSGRQSDIISARNVKEKLLGHNHVEVALTLNNLAVIY